MGNFYTNITLKGQPAEPVVGHLRHASRAAFVAACGNDTVVYDELGEQQDGSHVLLAAELSAVFGCTALAVLNHDDDVLVLDLFEAGALVGEHNSAPGYFDEMGIDEDDDGSPPLSGVALAATFGADAARVDAILAADRVFEVDRHAELVEAMGLPEAAVGFGHRYLQAGDAPDGVGTLVEVPG